MLKIFPLAVLSSAARVLYVQNHNAKTQESAGMAHEKIKENLTSRKEKQKIINFFLTVFF